MIGEFCGTFIEKGPTPRDCCFVVRSLAAPFRSSDVLTCLQPGCLKGWVSSPQVVLCLHSDKSGSCDAAETSDCSFGPHVACVNSLPLASSQVGWSTLPHPPVCVHTVAVRSTRSNGAGEVRGTSYTLAPGVASAMSPMFNWLILSSAPGPLPVQWQIFKFLRDCQPSHRFLPHFGVASIRTRASADRPDPTRLSRHVF